MSGDGRSLLLASASPRRAALLRQVGVSFQRLPVDVDETPLAGEAPDAFVRRLARTKAGAGRSLRSDSVALGADTAVVVDDEILGKPAGRDDALRMLAMLSGRTHRVYTGVALAGADLHDALSVSEVEFRAIPAEERAAYWDTGEPVDKAGAYAIQGLAGVFVKRLVGSFSGVMGLPLYETAELLREAGVPIWTALDEA